MSAIVPGVGQIYQGRTSQGVFLMLLAGFSLLLTPGGFGIVIYAGVWVYAVYSASKISISLALPDEFRFWPGTLLGGFGGVLFAIGLSFSFIMGAKPPDWAFDFLVVGGVLMFLGPTWYWLVRPVFHWWQ